MSKTTLLSLIPQSHLDQVLSHVGTGQKALDYDELTSRIRRAVYDAARQADVDGSHFNIDGWDDDITPETCDGLIGDRDGSGDIDIRRMDLWPRWFYDGYAIVQYGPALYRVDYTIDANNLVTAAAPSTWQMVEMAFVPTVGGTGVDDAIKAKDTQRDAEVVVHTGEAIKALGDGWVGGYLVRFGGEGDLSPFKDVFTKSTDFGDAETSDVYVHHRGLPEFKTRLKAKALLVKDDIGVFAKHLLDMRNEYEQVIYQLASEGKLGWSSGTAPHLVERKAIAGGKHEITHWPLGLDASYTPTPAGGLDTNVSALKAVMDIRLAALQTALPDEPSKAESKGAGEAHSDSGRARRLELELTFLDLDLED